MVLGNMFTLSHLYWSWSGIEESLLFLEAWSLFRFWSGPGPMAHIVLDSGKVRLSGLWGFTCLWCCILPVGRTLAAGKVQTVLPQMFLRPVTKPLVARQGAGVLWRLTFCLVLSFSYPSSALKRTWTNSFLAWLAQIPSMWSVTT